MAGMRPPVFLYISPKCACLRRSAKRGVDLSLFFFLFLLGGAPVSVARAMTYYICCVVVDLLVGPVVKASVSRAADRGSIPAFGVDFFPRSTHTSDVKTYHSVETLPGVWRYRLSVGTGWPGVSIL